MLMPNAMLQVITHPSIQVELLQSPLIIIRLVSYLLYSQFRFFLCFNTFNIIMDSVGVSYVLL